MVTAVDDGGAVRASKDVGGGQRAESPQDGGLGPKGHFLAVTQQACRKGARALGAAATELAKAGLAECNAAATLREETSAGKCILLSAQGSEGMDVSVALLSPESAGEIHRLPALTASPT